MKKLFFLLAVVAGMSFTNTLSAQTSVEPFTVEITTETTRIELHEMKGDLDSKGVQFNYNPNFNQDRVLVGIKVQVTFEDGIRRDYAINPMAEGQKLTIERIEENGEMVRFVGEK